MSTIIIMSISMMFFIVSMHGLVKDVFKHKQIDSRMKLYYLTILLFTFLSVVISMSLYMKNEKELADYLTLVVLLTPLHIGLMFIRPSYTEECFS